jgi:hypothetical protein
MMTLLQIDFKASYYEKGMENDAKLLSFIRSAFNENASIATRSHAHYDDLINFTYQCLKHQPHSRITLDDALAHPLFSSMPTAE